MSPNAYVHWNDESRLLYGFQGEYENEKPCFTWTYSTFEEYLGEACTPSMYNFFTNYICDEISKEELYEIQGGDYCPGRLEEEAVDAYFELPIKERIDLHMQEMKNLEAERDRASGKEAAFIDAILDEACPFDMASPIYVEYCQWCREQKEKWTKIHFDLCCQLNEETDWRGGHEEGAEDMETDENYDAMAE
jgi:hypothetical protein